MDNFELPPPLDLSHHFSYVTRRREASTIKKFYKYFTIPGIGNLAGGLPHPTYFPFDTLESRTALPNRFKPTPNDPVDPPPSKKKDPAANGDHTPTHILVPHDTHEPNPIRKIDLKTALQYGTAQGYPPLYQFVREFATTRLHPNIPYQNGAEVILTCGNTDGFAKSLEAFTNVYAPTPTNPVPISSREGLLCEEYAYMNAIQAAKPRGLNIVPIAMDAEGMLAHGHPKSLHSVLSNWDVKRDGGKRPHIMYTVTMGQNPTSGLLSVQRRKQIYAVCQTFDVLIVEDDPYFYIQFPHTANEFTQKHRNGELLSTNHFAEQNMNYQTSLAVPVKGTDAWSRNKITRMRRGKSSGSEFLDSLVPSYLSVDVDGRVIRLDTFSKTVAPGCRLGWITAQPEFIERILRITETSTQQPSGFVQSIIAELLIGPNNEDEPAKLVSGEQRAVGWKMDGWIRWLEGLRGNYERRMVLMSEILEEGKYATITKEVTSTPSRPARDTAGPFVTLPIRPRRRPDATVPSCTHSRSATALPSFGDENDAEADSFELLSKTQIYNFNPPMAGMFLWVRFNYAAHPLASVFSGPTLARAFWIFQTTEPYRVLTAPGIMFAPNEEIRDRDAWEFFRLCFAAIDDDVVKDMSERFVSAAHNFWDIKNKEDIQKLLDDNPEVAAEEVLQEQMTAGKWMLSPLMC